MTFTFRWVYNPSDVQQEIFKRSFVHKDDQAQHAMAYEEQRLVR